MSGLLGKVVRIDSEGAAPSLASLPEVASQVASQWKTSRASTVKPGECRLLFPAQSHPIAGVASGEQPRAPQTGPDSLPPKNVFLRNERLEWTRLAAAKGVRALRELGKINGEKQVIEVERVHFDYLLLTVYLSQLAQGTHTLRCSQSSPF